MPPAVLDLLRCPVCGGRLDVGAEAGRALRCAAGHSFDVARQGYVNLLTGAGSAVARNVDSAEMVRARVDFLGTGHYARVAEAVAAACPSSAGAVVDAGAGTGYYLAAVLDDRPEAVGLGLDLSKFALRHAARAHERAGAAVCDVWRSLPVVDDAADVVLNVFAPRNGPEFRRVLRPGGALLVVTPTDRHLAELRGPLGLLSVDAAKEERLRRSLAGDFGEAESSEVVEYRVGLSAAEAEALASMGPAARHVGADELRRRVAALREPARVTVSVRVAVFRRW
ncbi:methyltransferase domain-containing protein [Streptomyces sp. 8K308]|nr:methyltransferase domain-containing protein [Streptomyces sp. 8K308]